MSISVEAKKKKSKAAVEYEHPAKGMDHCRDCKFFEEPQVILPDAWCRLFKEEA